MNAVSNESDVPVNRVVSQQPQRLTIQERDARLDAIAKAIELLLYQAREAHTLGVASYVPFESLPKAWRRDLELAARAVVMHEALPRRQDADVAARAYLTRWLEAEAIGVEDAVLQIGHSHNERTAVERTLRLFIQRVMSCLGPSVVSQVLLSYQESLCGPETRSPRAQVARAAFASHTSGGAA